jgi:hypothetical protein
MLNGGAGDNILTGGSGADVFRFGNSDSITDFVSGEDKVDLAGLGVNGGNFWDVVSISQSGSDAWVSVGSARMHLAGVSANDLDLTDFIIEAAAAAEADQASMEAGLTMVRDLAPLEASPAMELNRFSAEGALTGLYNQADALHRWAPVDYAFLPHS